MTMAWRLIAVLRGILFLSSGLLLAWNAHATRRPASDPLHPLVQQAAPQPPAVTLHRYFETGGYETLSLQCRPERTERSQFQCGIERTRNGFKVAETPVDYERTREWMKGFFGAVQDLDREPLAEPQPGALQMRQALLGWQVAYEDRSAQGKLLRHQRAERSDVWKWILSLEGKLAAEFYRTQ